MNKEAQHNSNLTTACIEWEKTQDVATALLRTLLQYPVAGGCSAGKSPQKSCLPPVHKRHLGKFYVGSHPAALKCSGTEDGHWRIRQSAVPNVQKVKENSASITRHTAQTDLQVSTHGQKRFRCLQDIKACPSTLQNTPWWEIRCWKTYITLS